VDKHGPQYATGTESGWFGPDFGQTHHPYLDISECGSIAPEVSLIG